MLLPDLSWMQETTLALASLVAVLAVASMMLGLFSVVTGKDHLPKLIRRVLARVPASEGDHRLRGMSLMLNGAAMMLVGLGITANVMGMSNRGEFPADGLFFVTTVGLVASVICSVGSYVLYVRTTFVSTRDTAGAHPEIPPA